MSSDIQAERKSHFRNPLLYSSIFILVVTVFVGYLVVERFESKREYEKRTAKVEAEKRLESDRLAIEQLGGSELSIQTFYLSPTIVHPGESAQLCYDVANAKTVTLDPLIAEVWPSHSRCFDVKAKKSTTYTLSIADATGKSASQSVELKIP